MRLACLLLVCQSAMLSVSVAAEYDYRQAKETLDVFRMVYKGTFMAAGGFSSQAAGKASCTYAISADSPLLT